MKKRVLAGAVSLAMAGGLAWAVVPSVQAVAATTPALRLMPLGDSITWGVASSTGNGYRAQLYQDLAAEGHALDFVGSGRNGTMADPDNEGHSGWRIDQIAAIADTVLAQYKPNVVTLEIGTNDLNQGYQVSTAPARLSALVDQIVRDDPTAVVVVASLIPSTNALENTDWAAFNATIPTMVAAKQAAGDHVEYVSMSAVTVADLADQFHPGDAGYVKMGDAFNSGVQAAVDAGWVVPPVPNGGPFATGPVTSGIAGKCLDDTGGATANGTKIEIWDCNGGANQQWTPNYGVLQVSGKCLDVIGGGTANGTLVELWDCNGGANQVWQPQSNGTLLNPASGKCLDDPALSTTNGTQLEIWDCNGGANQQWALPRAPDTPTAGPVSSGVSGKCLDVAGNAGTNGTIVDLWDCNGTGAQRWTYVNGTVRVNGKCLDIIGAGSTANGSKVDIWDCNGGPNQAWNAVNGTLVNPASGKCLDDPAFSTTNGTQLEIYDCNGGDNQRWTW